MREDLQRKRRGKAGGQPARYDPRPPQGHAHQDETRRLPEHSQDSEMAGCRMPPAIHGAHGGRLAGELGHDGLKHVGRRVQQAQQVAASEEDTGDHGQPL
jgi:hypothetical protein